MKLKVGDEVVDRFDRGVGIVISTTSQAWEGFYPIEVKYSTSTVNYTKDGFQLKGNTKPNIRLLTKLEKALR